MKNRNQKEIKKGRKKNKNKKQKQKTKLELKTVTKMSEKRFSIHKEIKENLGYKVSKNCDKCFASLIHMYRRYSVITRSGFMKLKIT